jgi:hypothetical protein
MTPFVQIIYRNYGTLPYPGEVASARQVFHSVFSVNFRCHYVCVKAEQNKEENGMIKRKALFLLVIAVSCMALTATAAPVYVKVGGTGNGSSWANAYGSLQSALTNHPGAEIWVAAGTYKEPTIVWSNGSKAYGGFVGNEASRDQRDWIANQTILDGDNTRQVLWIVNDDPVLANIRLDGFIVQNGRIDTNDNAGGAGMYCKRLDGSNVIANCILRNNHVVNGGNWDAGGAVMCDGCPGIQFQNCTIENNSAPWSGGAMSFLWSVGVLENCIIRSNQAIEGAGINLDHFPSPSAKITYVKGCHFFNNVTTQASGGAIIMRSEAQVLLEDSYFTSNATINAGSPSGGAIFVGDDCVVAAQRCHFHNNTAVWDGGAINFMSRAQGSFANCVFTRNNARNGGAITFINGDSSGNTKTYLNLINCTFWDNLGTYEWSNTAIAAWSDNANAGVHGNALNCIFWAPDGRNLVAGVQVGNSCLSNSNGITDKGGNIATNPSFVGTNNLRLNAGSPCINTGAASLPGWYTPALYVTMPTHDMLLNTRPDGGGIDMGAYERNTTTPAVASIVPAIAGPTNAKLIPFTMTLTEGVGSQDNTFADFTAANFSFTPNNVGASVQSVTGKGLTRTILVNPGTPNGSLKLDLANWNNVACSGNLPAGAGTAYTGGTAAQSDVTPPVITRTGAATVQVECKAVYTDAGATASDNADGNITNKIVTVNPVNTSVLGSYTVTYNVTDAAGNAAAQITRTVTVVDSTKPTITLIGANPQVIECNTPYVELGATAADACEGDLTGAITLPVAPSTATTGNRILSYSVKDSTGNAIAASRTVQVVDTTAPVITRLGQATVTVARGGSYTDAGATASDSCDGVITNKIVTVNLVNVNVVGTYTVTYDVKDAKNNAATQVTRTVNVVDMTEPNVDSVAVESALSVLVTFTKDMTGAPGLLNAGTYTLSGTGKGTFGAQPASVTAVSGTIVRLSWVRPAEMLNGGDITVTVDPTLKDGNGVTIQVNEGEHTGGAIGAAPVITLIGGNAVTLECGDAYSEPGNSAADDVDASVTVSVSSDTVNSAVTGEYNVIYTATDNAGNTATATRTVTVEDTTGPVISLNGDAAIEIECGDAYTELSASATDACEGVLDNAEIVVGGDTVNTAAPGVYVITFDAKDSLDNAATQVTRTVTVKDTSAPVLTLNGDAAVEIECGAGYQEAGASATDLCEGDLSQSVVVGGDAVNTAAASTYVVTYNVSDSAGNAATEVTRTVTVVDKTVPVITLTGANPLVLDNGDTYAEPGAIAEDACDGSLTTALMIDAAAVNDRALGDYKVYYTVVDAAGNEATAERDVQVRRDACQLKYKLEVTPNPAVPGETITLKAVELPGSCAVGTLHFLWEKRGGGKADWMPISSAPDASQFSIGAADFDDAGDYRCSVSDDMITITSPVVTVVVGTGVPAVGLAGLALAGLLTAFAGGAALRKRD